MIHLQMTVGTMCMCVQTGLWDKSTYLDVQESPNHTGAWVSLVFCHSG